MTTIRVAGTNRGHDQSISLLMKRVAAFLPENYRIARWTWAEPERRHGNPAAFDVIVEGEDVAGWTAEGYVIPRLASGLMFAEIIGGEG